MITISEVSGYYIRGVIDSKEFPPSLYSGLFFIARSPSNHWEQITQLEEIAEGYKRFQNKDGGFEYAGVLQQVYPRTQKPDTIRKARTFCQQNALAHWSAQESFDKHPDTFRTILLSFRMKLAEDAYSPKQIE